MSNSRLVVAWNRFWKVVAVFAWKRVMPQSSPGVGRDRCGLPGYRDSLSVCQFYSPGPVILRDSHKFECWGDGHYMCKECSHYVSPTLEDDEP